MSEDPKGLVRDFYARISAGDVDAVDALVADDFVEHEEFPGISPDKAGVKQFFTMMLSAFPDLSMEPNEMLADGDLVCARVTLTGTQQGEFMGVPATGKRVEVAVMDMLRLRDGQAIEHWGVLDAMALMQQLGAVPAPA